MPHKSMNLPLWPPMNPGSHWLPGADWPCGGCGGFRMGRPDFCQKGASLSKLGPLELRLPI